MDLSGILELLTELALDEKITLRSLPTLYDPNGDITLTVRAVDVATREQFLADVAAYYEPAEPEAGTIYLTPMPEAEPEPKAAKKAAKLGGNPKGGRGSKGK